jgi:hypothetical protein
MWEIDLSSVAPIPIRDRQGSSRSAIGGGCNGREHTSSSRRIVLNIIQFIFFGRLMTELSPLVLNHFILLFLKEIGNLNKFVIILVYR